MLKRNLFLIIILSIVALFIVKGGLEEKAIQDRNAILRKFPILDAMNKLFPDEFDLIYSDALKIGRAQPQDTDIKELVPIYEKITLLVNARLGSLLVKSSDEAVNEYSHHRVKTLNKLLTADDSGVFCFNLLYPGVIGKPDFSKLKGLSIFSAFERGYLNSVADSISEGVVVNRLPPEIVENQVAEIQDALAEKYDGYYDIDMLSKNPKLGCLLEIDFYNLVLELEPHMAAEVVRYIQEVPTE